MAYGLLGNLVALLRKDCRRKNKRISFSYDGTLEDKEKDAFGSRL